MTMKLNSLIGISMLAALMLVTGASAQTSSLGARKREDDSGKPPQYTPREAVLQKGNPTYERHSLTAVPPPPPKTYKVNDLVTIIVRQSLQWEAESDLGTQRKWDIKSELEAFPKFTEGGIGASMFRRGKPNLEYKYNNKVKNKGDASREDKLTTRLTAKIIDVKPNGQLVVEGRGKITHDEEVSEITLTGTCRKEDITADNTVLSTQVAELDVVVNNQGALRHASSRGWLQKIMDVVKPF